MSSSMKLKDHYAVVKGNEIFFYRRKDDKQHKLMHSLIGTFIKQLEPKKYEQGETSEIFYPLKIIFPPNKSRVLYFKREPNMQYWLKHLINISGSTNVKDFYTFEDNIG